MRIILTLLFLLPASAFAQQPGPVVVDRDLWQQMSQALAALSMPLAAHQQAQQIIQSVEQEAAKRAATQKESSK